MIKRSTERQRKVLRKALNAEVTSHLFKFLLDLYISYLYSVKRIDVVAVNKDISWIFDNFDDNDTFLMFSLTSVVRCMC